MFNIDKLKYYFECHLLNKLEGISCEIPGIKDDFFYIVNNTSDCVFNIQRYSKVIDLNGRQLGRLLYGDFHGTSNDIIFITKQIKKVIKTHFYPDYSFTYVLNGVRRKC